MLRAITAATSSASAAPLPVREAPAAAASAQAGSQPAPVAPVESAAPQLASVSPQTFRYNSTEFVYRQDIGRIILIGQSPVTGERKIQIPSEEALRAYERTIRAEEQRSLLAGQSQGQGQKQGEPGSAPAATPTPAPVSTPKAPAVPSLAQALSAVVGDGGGQGGLVSVSA